MINLNDISIFKNLSDNELASIAKLVKRIHFAENEIVLNQGDLTRNLFLVESGKLKVFICNDNGTQFTLSTLSSGQYFGEFAFLEESKRAASVITLCETSLLEITQDDFTMILEKYPSVYKTMVKNLISAIKEKDQKIKQLSIDNTYPKLKQYLIDHSVSVCRRTTRREPVTAESIATSINCPTDSIAYILYDLEENNYINIEVDIIYTYKTLPEEQGEI
ncbi:MAG: cyclic nucleotide-binding domain-containing protein [Gammaproteobacteria bacterium]|nr:cyclic nucleotide-binding domain-containing protein [Gammaproteobacteria bacterium]